MRGKYWKVVIGERLDEEIGAPDEDCAHLALRMDTNTSRGWNSGGRAFLRGIGQRVSFDPEAPPPPSQPARKIDEKVKVSIIYNIFIKKIYYLL